MHSYPIETLTPSELTGLAAHLYRDGLLDFKNAQAAMNQRDKSITQYLVEARILSSEVILDYCAKQFGLPIYDLKKFNHDEFAIIKLELIYRLRVIPLYCDQKFLYLGITDPTNHTAITTLSFHTGLYIRPVLIAEHQLSEVINALIIPSNLNSQLETTLAKITPIKEQFIVQEIIDQDDEPVIEFVDQMIKDAIKNHASDIHIEPSQSDCRIRFRIDGILTTTTSIPSHLAACVNIRLKIMANLNIAEKRLPQDGRITFPELKIDIRINTCPTLFGEKIVLRLSHSSFNQLNIYDLGMQLKQEKLFLKKLAQPQGLILVTGPTGSGKTLTLYSALQYLNQIEKNISTVEDPVEIELQGINQVNINLEVGLTFAIALKTLLRQDPDVIMIGEIRDTETANIALQAAQTGHLVLATLHTNSALEVINRLKLMQVPTYFLAGSILLIIGQRLLRRLCPACKQAEIMTADVYQECKQPAFITYRAIGCKACYQGYLGRIAIFELVTITEKSGVIVPAEDFISLWEAGFEKVRDGVTSLAELMRVVGGRELA